MKSYDNVEKLLKGNLKRKVKLTLVIVVTFLITGTLGFAESGIETPKTTVINENKEYKDKWFGYYATGVDEVINNAAIISKGVNDTKNFYMCGLYNNVKKIVNNGRIISEPDNNTCAIGIVNKCEDAVIENNGEILSESNLDKNSYGIYNSGKVITLISNKGIISSKSLNEESYGVGSFNKSIKKFENIGNILSYGENEKAFGLYFNSGSYYQMDEIFNTGSIISKGNHDTNENSNTAIYDALGLKIINKGYVLSSGKTVCGIEARNDSEKEGKNFLNIGKTKAESLAEAKGGERVHGYRGKWKTEIFNTGIISAIKNSEHYSHETIGILIEDDYVSNEHKDDREYHINNRGKIEAKKIGSNEKYEYYKLYGIYIKSEKPIKNNEIIKNYGTIKSELIVANKDDEVVGSYYISGIKINELYSDINNIGTVSVVAKAGLNKKNYGISIYKVNNNKELNNIGIVYSNNGLAVQIRENTLKNLNNYGMLIGTEKTTEGVDSLNNYGFNIVIANDGTITDEGKSTETLVGSATVDGKVYNTISNVGTKDKSIELSSNVEKSIYNGIKDVVKINEEIVISDSILNAYENVISLNDKELTLKDSVVNGGLKEKTSAILGDNNDNKLVLETSIINGDIDLKDGNNNIKVISENIVGDEYTPENLSKYTIINGNIKAGTGNDNLNFGNTIVNGKIDLGAGENNINLKNSFVNNSLNLGTGNDTISLSNNSIINGDIDLGAGDDNLIISSDSKINGDIDLGTGEDTLTFKKKEEVRLFSMRRAVAPSLENINIMNNISGAKNININSGVNVTLFEGVKLNDVKKLEIKENAGVSLRIDPNKKVGGEGEDKNNIKAGALYSDEIEISGAGALNIVSAGLTSGDKLNFGNTKLDSNLNIETDSAILDIEDMIVKKETNIKLSDNVARHDRLNNIYTQILDDNLKDINTIITTAETDKVKQVEMLSSYLNGVYAENPYSLSSEFSRKSAELMRNSILSNREKAIKNEQITYGGLTHQDGSLDGSYYGMDANKANRYSGDIELESNLFGAYGAIEYGYFDKTSLGFVVGGSRGDSKVGSSKVDGNTIYTGLYSKTDLPYNLRLTVGTGVQHGSYDAERNYLSDNHKGNYSDTAFDIYANIKYTQMLQENLFLDYGFGMSYTYVDQDSISEEKGSLAIDVDSKTFDYTDAKLDLGLRKVIGNNYGKHNLKLGASYSYMLDGADEENLRGNFKGTNSFDILVAEKEKDMFGVNIGYELERENGFMLNANAGYNISNSDNDEMVVGVQIGKKL